MNTKTDDRRLLITPRETARLLSVSLRTLDVMAQRGDLTKRKIGKLARYSLREVEALANGTGAGR